MTADDVENLPWAAWVFTQCRARKERNPSGFWGRCELKYKHKGDHALERGNYILRWSTEWTNY